MRIRLLLLLNIFIVQNERAFSQGIDTIDLTTPGVKPIFVDIFGSGTDLALNFKSFLVNEAPVLHSIFKKDIVFRKLYDSTQKTADLRGNLGIRECSFFMRDDYFLDYRLIRPISLQGLFITDCKIASPLLLSVSGNAGREYADVKINDNDLHSLNINNSKLDLEFRSDTISGWLEIYSCNINSFKGVDIIPREGRETLRINQCRLNDFTYSTRQKERLDIRFWRDTINGSFSIIDTSNIDTSKNVTISFYSCYINASMQILQRVRGAKVLFSYCKFGPDAMLENMAVDTIDFNLCKSFESPVLLENLGARPCHISFNMTDVDNLLFDYGYWFKIYNPLWNSDDRISNTYEALLAKFRREGKIYSIKNLDIEYKQYKYANNWHGGSIMNFFDKVWWNYGYEPAQPFLWALVFVLFFFMINLWKWEKVQQVYNITPFVIKNWYQQQRNKKMHAFKILVHIFIFTVLIFFSVYINFDKLSFRSTRWLVWFFVQYLVGLFCLFFIVNAIIKF